MPASNLKATFQAAQSADEVEEACLSGVSISPEAGVLDSRISGESTDDPIGDDAARWPRETQRLDDETGAITDEIHRRINSSGDGYPFRLLGNSLRYVGSRSLAYEFCLAISRAHTIVADDFVRLPRNFERLSAIAARLYLGDGAKCFRLGAPTDGDDPKLHPKNFTQRIAWLKETAPADSGEWDLQPIEGFDAQADAAKDCGMDFVAWKPFPDERIGRITLLGQCACGRNDQNDDRKLKDLDLKKLGLLFRTLMWLGPVKLFATPFHVADPTWFKAMHHSGNMIFDRLRIAAVCEGGWRDSELRKIRPRLKTLIELVVGKVKLAEVGRAKYRGASRKPT